MELEKALISSPDSDVQLLQDCELTDLEYADYKEFASEDINKLQQFLNNLDECCKLLGLRLVPQV